MGSDHRNVYRHRASDGGRSCIAWLARLCHDALAKRSLLEQALKEAGVGAFARLNRFLRGKIPSRLLRKATRMFSRSCDTDGSEVDT